MTDWSRREVLQRAAILAGAVAASGAMAEDTTTASVASGMIDDTRLRPLERVSGGAPVELTWGTPWRRGMLKQGQPLKLISRHGNDLPVQTWNTAYWPDGSVKWTAHATLANPADFPDRITPGIAPAPSQAIDVRESGTHIEISTGVIVCSIPRAGGHFIDQITRDNRPMLQRARLVAMRQDTPGDATERKRDSFASRIESVIIEQTGPIRAVVRIKGVHTNDAGRAWLPFTLRLYFYAGSDVVRLMHTFVFDGDEYKDFLCGLGVRCEVPMRDASHDRHIRFVGQEHGLFAEAVRGITGLRRDPGDAVRRAQTEGRPTPPLDQWATSVTKNLEYVPEWGDYTLAQLCADGFQIRKRTKPGHAWVAAASGRRAAGVASITGATGGGIAFGMRDFWQKHPVQIDLRHAHTDLAEATVWMYSPEAQPMDMRFYHDGLGQDTYQKQRDALDITYEDYEKDYGTPFGIARTTELFFQALPATPARQAAVEFADRVRVPTMLVCEPQRYLDAGVFGAQWTLPDASTPVKKWIEDKLDFTLTQYVKEVDQRSWYGFWDFGDVMHSYDDDRHVWRYDIGGFAWDNSELSTDIWLWMSFLRTGRADVFRMAEAMTRHTGEVDVYHLGRFKGLGTRHNVQHWGCSSKQTRISTAANRRYYYFLTADERVGDLLREQLDAVEAEKKIVVGRKLAPDGPMLPLPPVEDGPRGGEVDVGSMGFGNMMAAWITEAERSGDPVWHGKIVTAMNDLAKVPNAFFAAGWRINIDTGAIAWNGNKSISTSHLATCFGLPEICHELILTYGDHAPKFADAWAQYGWLYNGSREDRQRVLNITGKPGSLRDTHSRCTAYAAMHNKDPKLAARAWNELLGDAPVTTRPPHGEVKRLTGPDVLNPIDAIPMGSNGSQWLLAAMECLAFIGETAPRD